jgi:hypothetical protein
VVEIDVARVLADARELAFPRASGTPGNRRACRLVADKLREAGLDVAEEEFSYDLRPALRALRAALLVAAAFVGSAGMLAPRSPGWALALLGAGVLVGGVLLIWAPGVERIYAAPGPTVTWNVVGRRPSTSPRSAFVVLAHYDSKSQNLSLPLRMGATVLAILGTVATGLLAALALALAPMEPAWLPAVTGGAAAVALLTLSTLSSGNRSPGGVDNAGSVAILLELARKLPAVVPASVELVFLSPGAEEDHMVGAMRFLDAHRTELGLEVRALNLDGAGAPGRPVILASYGVWHRFAPAIERTARESARRLGLRPRSIWLPPAIGVDAIPFHHRGVPCLTLASGSLGRATLAVHSARDVADHLDETALTRVARWAADVVVTSASAAPPGSRPCA